MQRQTVVSSHIKSIGYNSGLLEIEFRDGSVYQYSQVPEPIYKSLMESESKGRFVRNHIVPGYNSKPITERIVE